MSAQDDLEDMETVASRRAQALNRARIDAGRFGAGYVRFLPDGEIEWIDPRCIDRTKEIAAIDRRLVRYFGKRCSEYEIGCFTCQAWRARDDIARAFEIVEED